MKQLTNDTHADISGGAAMMGVVIATLIAIVCGVLVWYKINAAVFASGKAPYGAGVTYNAYNATWLSVNTTANTIWTLFPIVCIVLIAGIVLAVVMGFGRGGV
jgi:hypothetical protein